MLEIFGMHKGGTEYRRLVAAFERIFDATIFFGTDQLRGTAKMVQQSRFNFLREAQLSYNKRPGQPVLSDRFENVIVLSIEFYQEITAHPIPTDLDAVRTLAASPAVLDLFMWLSYWSPVHSALRLNWVMSNMLVRGDFTRSWRAGSM